MVELLLVEKPGASAITLATIPHGTQLLLKYFKLAEKDQYFDVLWIYCIG